MKALHKIPSTRSLVCLLKNQTIAGRSKMVRCKEAKKSRPRGVFKQISGLDFFADAADRRFGAAC
jgi:hypothetical protein